MPVEVTTYLKNIVVKKKMMENPHFCLPNTGKKNRW